MSQSNNTMGLFNEAVKVEDLTAQIDELRETNARLTGELREANQALRAANEAHIRLDEQHHDLAEQYNQAVDALTDIRLIVAEKLGG